MLVLLRAGALARTMTYSALSHALGVDVMLILSIVFGTRLRPTMYILFIDAPPLSTRFPLRLFVLVGSGSDTQISCTLSHRKNANVSSFVINLPHTNKSW